MTFDEFCDWYAEAIKPRLYEDDADAQATALAALERLLALLHPVLAHVTEEIWSNLPGRTTRLIASPWPAPDERFAARGIDRDASATLMRRSVELAVEARSRYRSELVAARPPTGPAPTEVNEPLLVAASVGPIGATRADGSEYRGDHGLSVDELADWHRDRLAVLASAGPDLLACETIATVSEAEALIHLLEEDEGPPAWLAFTCADERTTHGGDAVETAFALADRSERVVAVGINCTDPRFVDELVTRARATTRKPIVVYPNSGEAWDAIARRWVGQDRQLVDDQAALRWSAAGATLVGGCCRVGPERIATIARALRGGEAGSVDGP